MQIDIMRLMRAMLDLDVQGICNSPARASVIESCIGEIQRNGREALAQTYPYVKQYAQFGDQRESARYGFGPKHGHIVFAVKRRSGERVRLGLDHIYLLECCRDFPGVSAELVTADEVNRDRRAAPLGLCSLLRRRDRYFSTLQRIDQVLADFSPETSDGDSNG